MHRQHHSSQMLHHMKADFTHREQCTYISEPASEVLGYKASLTDLKTSVSQRHDRGKRNNLNSAFSLSPSAENFPLPVNYLFSLPINHSLLNYLLHLSIPFTRKALILIMALLVEVFLASGAPIVTGTWTCCSGLRGEP